MHTAVEKIKLKYLFERQICLTKHSNLPLGERTPKATQGQTHKNSRL